MNRPAVPGPVILRGRPLSPGRESGSVTLSDEREEPEHVPKEVLVLALASARWPDWRRPPENIRAVIVTGPGAEPRPDVPVPAVGDIDPDLLRKGDRVEVDGARGTLELLGVSETPVVTAFLRRDDGRVLLLRRSAEVRTFRGRWAGVSGYLESPTALEQARTEVREETGIPPSDLVLAAEGELVRAREGNQIFVVHPFLFRVGAPEVRLDREHVEAEWVDAAEIARRQTVPKLVEAWESVVRRAALGKS